MLLKACLNGARHPREHPALPVTPDELAQDAARVGAAGADAVHLHVKDDRGEDTLEGDALAAVLEAVRRAVPGLPIGVTTGAWAVADPARRVGAVRAWTSLPDFASVNWHEPGAEQVASALMERDVGVEAGLWHGAALRAWLTSPLRQQCLRVLLELPDGPNQRDTEAEADRLLDQLHHGASPAVQVLLHGEGSSCWPALRHARRLGLATRIGLEDVLVLPDGSPAPDNAALVVAASEVQEGDGQRDA